MVRNKRCAGTAAAVVVLLAMAPCNFSGDDTPTPSLTSIVPTSTPTVCTPEATSTPSPSPTVTPTLVACAPDAAFVADVTVLDGTVLRPSTSFTKTWRVQNDGPCPWEPGTVLAFVSGHQMDGPAAVEAGAVAAGESTDLSVGLTAPALPGGYEGTWRLQSGEGDAFGPGLVVSIVVEAATATPPPACVALDSALEPILTLAEDAGHNPGCPIGPAVTVNGAIQLFETEPGNPDPKARIRGFMIWRADQEIIYALGSGWASDSLPHDGDVLHVYEDEWTEGMPAVHPDCASMSVLPGYRLPVRGFGRAWCENSLWEDSELGWPTDAESGVILVIQPTCNGVLMRLLAHPWGISWDFSLDIPGERWYSTATGP